MLITGYTTDKLESIKNYQGEIAFDNELVMNLTGEMVLYRIGTITYKTYFSDNKTIFFYTTSKEVNKDKLVGIDIFANSISGIENNLNLNRNNFSVFESFFKLDTIENSDLDSFPLNYL